MATKTLTLYKVENGTIFQPDFSPFAKNNVITFSSADIAVIYGPNGTGKTSLAKVMSSADNTAIECLYEGARYTDGKTLFHVINDQNNRNIIAGTAQDFLLGSNIKREFELEQKISEQFSEIKKWLVATLKSECGISAANSKLIPLIQNAKISALVKDLANARSRGNNYSTDQFIKIVSSISPPSNPDIDNRRWGYFVENYGNSNSVIMKVLSLTAPDFSENTQASEIEEDSIAIDVLSHFKHKSHCIVCDNNKIDSKLLIERKTHHRQAVIDALTEQMRTFIEDIIALPPLSDPFDIKANILSALEKGEYDIVKTLQKNICEYKKFFAAKIDLLFLSMLHTSGAIDVPKCLTGQVFDNAVVSRGFVTNNNILHKFFLLKL